MSPDTILEIDEGALADIAEDIYRRELGEKGVVSMIAQDGDAGAKLRRHAQAYARFARITIEALVRRGVKVPGARLVAAAPRRGAKGGEEDGPA